MEPKLTYDNDKAVNVASAPTYSSSNDEDIGIVQNVNQLSRTLSWRQMQLMIIGGSIGTALFVTIGAGLISAGPGSLLLGFILYSTFLAACSNCMAEMSIYMPVSGGWIRMASHWVDDSLGFALGWNFFLYEATLIPYEISALNLVITFWSDKVPAYAVCVGCIVLYGLVFCCGS
jgi:amino acid transporter